MQTQTNKPKQKSTIWIFSPSQRHYTCSVCPLFWLELPLGHIMTASHFSFSRALRSFLLLTGKVHLCQPLQTGHLTVYYFYTHLDISHFPNPALSKIDYDPNSCKKWKSVSAKGGKKTQKKTHLGIVIASCA